MSVDLGVFLINVCSDIIMFLTTAYIYIKVSVFPISKYYKKVFILFIGSLLIGVIYALLRVNDHPFSSIVIYLYPSIFFIVFEKEKRVTKCLIAFISSSFPKIVSFVPTVFVAGIIAALNPRALPEKDVLLSQVTVITVSILTFGIVFLLLKIKRIKRGFQFFQNEDNLGFGLALSGILFILFGINYAYGFKEQYWAIILFFGGFAIGIGLFLWIKRSITAHYREKLQIKSEIYYKEQLEQKEQDIERLNQSNEFLAKIVHRDNHLMSSLDSSINAYFESGDKDFKDGVLREIQTLSKERGELIKAEQRDVKLFPSTGNVLIDSAISDLYIKAASHGIDFDLSISTTVDEVIGKFISQTDLQTLICDHIKDAIIAVDAKSESNGKIFVDLSMQNGSYAVTIFDSGVDFEVDTLAKLGKERVTTHADNGGSGIGFMTTFETLRKSYASLIINEFENKTPFSKSISISFDGNTAFIIQSYRKEELQPALNRDDVILL